MGALIVASVAFGSASILIRLAGAVSPLSLTAFRLIIAWVVVFLFAAFGRKLYRLSARQVAMMSASGVALAAHFATFISAVQITTVASASFLVNTSPVFVAVLGLVFLREKPSIIEGCGALTAVVGIALVFGVGSSFMLTGRGLGEASAVTAALLMAAYTLLGRRLGSDGIGATVYVVYVYGTAASTGLAIMLLGVGAGSATVPSEASAVAAIVGLGLIPTVLGHGLYNYALGWAKALPVSLFALVEPVLASIAAYFLFAETPNTLQMLGYTLIMLGVALGGKAITANT